MSTDEDEDGDAPDGGYRAAYAAFYDQHVAADREDVAFYTGLARERAADGPTLELACGTGRIYLELLRAGVDADGIDLSDDALAVLRENAASEGLEPSVWRADVADFDVDREYALVICPFNAFQHLRRLEDQRRALECVHEALAPGGEFVFDVFVPSFELICETYGEWQTRSVTYRSERHEVATRTRIVDEVEQEFVSETELSDADGSLVFSESHRLKMLPKREVELLAHLSPFSEWDVTGGFDRPEARTEIEDGDSVQLWRFRKGT